MKKVTIIDKILFKLETFWIDHLWIAPPKCKTTVDGLLATIKKEGKTISKKEIKHMNKVVKRQVFHSDNLITLIGFVHENYSPSEAIELVSHINAEYIASSTKAGSEQEMWKVIQRNTKKIANFYIGNSGGKKITVGNSKLKKDDGNMRYIG